MMGCHAYPAAVSRASPANPRGHCCDKPVQQRRFPLAPADEPSSHRRCAPELLLLALPSSGHASPPLAGAPYLFAPRGRGLFRPHRSRSHSAEGEGRGAVCPPLQRSAAAWRVPPPSLPRPLAFLGRECLSRDANGEAGGRTERHGGGTSALDEGGRSRGAANRRVVVRRLGPHTRRL